MRTPVKRSLHFGLHYSIVGFVVGFYITVTSVGNYSYFYIYSTFGAFITQFATWYILVERPKKFSLKRTAAVGALGALLSHYVCWYCFLIVANIQYRFFGLRLGSLGDEPIDLFTGLGAMWLFTLFSWLFVGWVTVPMGAFLGTLYGYRIKRGS